ncbi:MAG: fluoride efflux transporter CrcB [Candidatus Sumerlaeia bacterium]|nr:fluoride efflux transporter CrcB [Candidatus Sumerlaeia bacterium]
MQEVSAVFKLLLIAAGGSLGALMRYGLAGAVQRLAGAGFPWGTFLVNVTGCLAIGFLWDQFDRTAVTPEVRAFALIGVLGAYTTFSTFGLETLQLLREGQAAAALLNVALSNAAGLAAVFVGVLASRLISTAA